MSIGKVGKSKTSGGVVNYIFKKQKGGEKEPKIIGGNITGKTKKEIKAEFRDQEKLNPNVKNTTIHFSVSLPPGKNVSDEDAADYADAAMQEMGLDKNPYIVVRHYDKEKRNEYPFGHIHIAVSRVKDNGTLIPEWEIAERFIETTKIVDKRFNLESVEYIKLNAGEKLERSVKKDEYQMMANKGNLSILEEFKDCADASLDKKTDVRKFVSDVRAGGFEVAPNILETTGEMRGFSFSKDGIVFTAKKAGNKFKWTNISPKIDYQPERDAKFLHQLKVEFTARKEAEKKAKEEVKKEPEKQPAEKSVKQPGEAIKATVKAAKNTKKQIIGVVENEATSERETTHQSVGNEASAENGQAIREKSDSKKQIAALEKPPREKSDQSMEQTEVTGAQSAQIRHDRTDNQTARGGQEVTGNNRDYFNAIGDDGEKNTSLDAEGERGFNRRASRFDHRAKRDDESENKHRQVERGTAASQTANDFGGTAIEGSDERTRTLSDQVRESQVANDGGFESGGFVGSRIPDAAQRAAGKRASTFTDSVGEDERADRFGSAANTRGEEVGSFERAEIVEQSHRDDLHIPGVNRAADFNNVNSGVLLRDEQRFEQDFDGGQKKDGGIKHPVVSGRMGENYDRAEFQPYGNESAANLPGGRQILQSVAGRADEDRSGSTDTNRRTAEKTAQIINIKRFSGGLDWQIVAQWTSIIEKSDIEKPDAITFLNEVTKPKSREEEQQMFEQLDTQAALIAAQLKLPPPEPESKPNVHKLAVALTKIEVANYEQASGEPLSSKVFEVLVKENMRRATSDAPPQPEQIERLRETFGDTAIESTVKPSSDLEAETLNALLDSVKYGFDASAVIEAQRVVNTNEAAAQATATLVQIAYGGQTSIFTDNFKNDLAERIYYAPVPAIDFYQHFRQFEWQQTIEHFAPTVNNLAEHYKIEIKPPDGDSERNRLLADFVTRQLVEAYESQNNPLEKFVQIRMAKSCMQGANVAVYQSQKDTIATLTDQNLKPPEFSRSLEASAYNLTRYDEEKKVTQAVNIADQIREIRQIEAKKQVAVETSKERILTM